MNLEMYHDTFDLFCKSIKKDNAEVLELGFGPGNITKYILQKRPDFNIFIKRRRFTILDERRKTHPQYVGTTTKDLIIIAKKELLFSI
ncbi:hypothetical protein [Aquimarina macrocephali]|uniref:hypothetical protein n=1 Tax=Aquimarina macrocephali TaxID=666563 RepID=UPI003F670EE0